MIAWPWNFPWTNASFLLCFRLMAQPEQKFTSPASLVVDAILVIGFFVFMFGVLQKHVPSNDPNMIMLWAALSSACISGVFWLAVQMFRVVFRAQREANRAKK